MDYNMYSMDEFRREQRRKAIKEKIDKAKIWACDRVKAGYEFCRDNTEEVAFFTAGGLAILKVISKHKSLNDEKELKEGYCYDRSLGHYWRLKRKLSNREWLEIDARKRNGERLSDILSEMRLLK